jgi:ABC-type Zn uptake system ZnuABC Zn-binding protein ZnuA
MYFRKVISIFIFASLVLAACAGTIPAASNDGLKVVASTTIVGDIVDRVGGDMIDLTVLFPVDADPHTYEPRPKDAAAISEADVVVIHGLHLEEALDSILDSNVNGTLIHAAEGIEVLEFAAHEHEGEVHEGEDEHAHEDEEHEGEDEHAHEGEEHDGEGEHAHEGEEHETEEGHVHDHGDGDPHTWTDPNNVMIWTQNITSALSEADPENAAKYQANAKTYIDELRELDSWIRTQVESIPTENRELVTDHLTFGYFGDEYGFEQVGLVIPAISTSASTSSKELAELIDTIEEHNVPAIFVGSTVNPTLAEQVAEDTGMQIVYVYTGSLSEPGGEAGSYLEFMRYNVKAFVEALK